MSAIPYLTSDQAADILGPDVPIIELDAVAKALGVSRTKVQQIVRDRELIAVRRDGVLGVPAPFFGDDGQILRWMPGLLAVLHDGGFQDDEILRWLYTEDDSLPGRPIDVLHTEHAREVIRRAQAMGF